MIMIDSWGAVSLVTSVCQLFCWMVARCDRPETENQDAASKDDQNLGE